jgi:RecJ-like exonuclease
LDGKRINKIEKFMKRLKIDEETLKVSVEEQTDPHLISDISHRFVCHKCGIRGIVKILVICDECDLQVKVGWSSTEKELIT